jgi:putative ABC transport system ATP-binding protein
MHRFGSGFTLDIGEMVARSGEHTACIGPSGCGKTTLLRILTGILEPTQGHIELLGQDLSTLDNAERRTLRLREVGMVFQQFALLEHLCALDNILLPVLLGGGQSRAVRDRAHELAQATGIAHALKRKPARLSQGERQRVAICRALVTAPRLIVCDEPTGNLDPTRSRSVVDLLLSEAQRLGSTVMLVTHDPSLLGGFGRVLDLGNPNGSVRTSAVLQGSQGSQPSHTSDRAVP